VYLHHLFCKDTAPRVQIIYVLRDEQEIVRVMGESCDCFVRGIRPGIADTLSSLAIPFPN
jgi:hypothetical protein